MAHFEAYLNSRSVPDEGRKTCAEKLSGKKTKLFPRAHKERAET